MKTRRTAAARGRSSLFGARSPRLPLCTDRAACAGAVSDLAPNTPRHCPNYRMCTFPGRAHACGALYTAPNACKTVIYTLGTPFRAWWRRTSAISSKKTLALC